VLIFTVTGVILYRDYAPPSLGNPVEHGVSFTRSLGAGLSGGLGAMIGLGLLWLVEKIRGKS
jgi:hypothetical protein